MRVSVLLGCAAALFAAPAMAADEPRRGAVGSDLFFSTDAEDTSVIRAGLNLDFVHEGPEKYYGVRVEKAWFEPLGGEREGRTRVYLRAADDKGPWKWNATIGTDGDTVLGSATIHDEAKFRKELFIEREILETPLGLKRGIYYTFLGAAIDLPADDRNVVTLVGGVQKFTGDNVRTHLRATAVHVFNPDQGLSVQLRTRYFHNSDPREFDYYSPRWYVSAVPVLQIRRFTASGWRYLLAGGVGVQRDADTDWRRSSYFNAQVSTPVRRAWSGNASLLFSETPTTSGQSYNYLQLTFGVSRAF
ncbi:MAG TPA: hypothetical protein VIL42_01650 [Sphingomicrobium sp.]|jgi:hypothetical protein